jgi:hypothetical protein
LLYRCPKVAAASISPIENPVAGAGRGMPVREEAARFYVGCLILGLDHLLKAALWYQALACEDLLVSQNGYIVLADYSTAQRMKNSDEFGALQSYFLAILKLLQRILHGREYDGLCDDFDSESAMPHDPYRCL